MLLPEIFMYAKIVDFVQKAKFLTRKKNLQREKRKIRHEEN